MVCLVVLLAAPCLEAASQGGPIPLPLPLFPGNNWWNTDVSGAPIDPASSAYISFIGATRALHPDYGGDVGDGTIYGFPFIQVDGAQAKRAVTFDVPEESDGVDHSTETSFPFYPIPDEAITNSGWIEAGPPGNQDVRNDFDRHMLIVDTTNNTLYEIYNVWYNGTAWEAYSGAFFDMKTNDRRPEGWTSADAAGLAILPGLVRYDEVYGPTEIGHAFRVTVRNTNGHVWPASHTAGSTAGALPMGARLRLKASKDISGYPADVQKIFRALKSYGLIVADNGSDMYIQGTYDNRWDMDVMNGAFGDLTASDFEVVQLGWQPPATYLFALPHNCGAGDAVDVTLTAYDPSYNVATGYRGSVHFTSSDGAATLPPDYAFTAADNGSHAFSLTLRTAGARTVTARDTSNATITSTRSVVVGPPAPTGLTATATSATHVDLAWNASPGATQYEVSRASAGSAYAVIGTTAALTFGDSTVTGGASWVYRLRALDSSAAPSGTSVPDAATTIFFTDSGGLTGMTVKAAHVSELRAAVNAMRAAAGLSAASFTGASLGGVPVSAVHVQELRTALAQARSSLGLPPLSWTDPGLASGTTVRAVHLEQLRDGVR